MELTRDEREILETAVRAGEINRAGMARVVKAVREKALVHEVQQGTSLALQSLIEKGYLQASSTVRELYVPTVGGRTAAKASAAQR